MSDIVKTEVQLSDDSIQKILVTEVAKIILAKPDYINEIVKNVLFTRPPKRNSYDKDQPTFFESSVKKTFEPMLEEIIGDELQKHKPALKKIIAKALKTNILDHGEFADRLLKAMAKYTSRINFYIPSD